MVSWEPGWLQVPEGSVQLLTHTMGLWSSAPGVVSADLLLEPGARRPWGPSRPPAPPAGLLTSQQLPVFCQLILRIGNFLNYVSGCAPAALGPTARESGRSLLSLAGQPHGGRRWLQDQHAAEAHGDQVAAEPCDAAAPRPGGGWGPGGPQAPPCTAPGRPSWRPHPALPAAPPGRPPRKPLSPSPRPPAPVQPQGHGVDVPSAKALPRGGLVVPRARGSLDVCRCRRRRRATQTSCSCRGSWSSRPRRQGRCPSPVSVAHSRATPLVRLGLTAAGHQVPQEPLPDGMITFSLGRELMCTMACPRVT